MAKSLQQQLMSAGLANKKQARQAKHAKRVQASRQQAGDEQETSAQRAQRLQQEKAAKDRQLAAQQQARREAAEAEAQIRQLIVANRLARTQGDQAYQFVDGKKIQKVYVTAEQHKQLSNGRLALVSLAENYELVPAQVAEKIAQRDGSCVLVLNNDAKAPLDEDDPYADYVIPDDLMW